VAFEDGAAPVRQRVREDGGRVPPAQPVPLEAEGAHHGGGAPQRVEGAAQVADVAGVGAPVAAHGPARLGLGFEDLHVPSGVRQHVGGDEPVGPGADDHGVRHGAPSLPRGRRPYEYPGRRRSAHAGGAVQPMRARSRTRPGDTRAAARASRTPGVTGTTALPRRTAATIRSATASGRPPAGPPAASRAPPRGPDGRTTALTAMPLPFSSARRHSESISAAALLVE